ncbi:Ca2+ regulator and membrane fusion protein Fig1-domain-containing protein [Hypomontagnella monticulosa]|nr:Ca2+ regulator and membrane fusion protein Fig1-domain-containing protein [Hypomontagnella monticulosa]
MSTVFRVPFYRYMPYIGFHHILMFLNVTAIVLWSILLAGCSSSNDLRNVYLLSLSYKDKTATPLTDPLQVNPSFGTTFSNALKDSTNATFKQINISHMSTCIKLVNDVWICGSNAQELVDALKSYPQSDPLNLAWAIHKFQSESIFYPLIFVAIIFASVSTVLLMTFPGWHAEEDSEGSDREILPFPSRRASTAAFLSTGVASTLSFISVFWQHIACACASSLFEALTYGLVDVHIGSASMALGWVGFGISCVSSLGMLLLILSFKLLAELTV